MTATNGALDKQAYWQRLMSDLLGYQTTWVADIGLKSGLFRAIAKAGADGIAEEALARQLGFAPRYVQVWCRAAYAFELVEWSEGRGYTLSPALGALLFDPSDPQYMGGRMQFYAALYEDFRAFPEYLKRGETWPRAAHDCGLLEAIKNATRPDSRVLADVIVNETPDAYARLARGGRLLDIGAGGGYALVEYARRFPAAEIAGIEIDEASVALAKRTVADAELRDRVSIRQTDANRLDELDRYDVVTMNIALHETGGPDEYRNVLERVRRALRPGGVLLVSELPYPDSPGEYRAKPVYKLLAGIQFHEALVGCGMITQNQLRLLLKAAAFATVREIEQPIPARFMMIAEKAV